MPVNTVSDVEKTPEQRGDELMAQGKFRESAYAYCEAYRPFQGCAHLTRITKKQTEAMRQLFRQEYRA